MEPELKKQKLERVKGIAPIKKEYVLDTKPHNTEDYADEAAEGAGLDTRTGEGNNPGSSQGKKGGKNKKDKQRGQNKNRKVQQKRETIRFCEKIKDTVSECTFGEKCRFEHDLTKYIEAKPKDIEGVCPVYQALGFCPAGVKCRWLGSHFQDNKLTTGIKAAEGAELQELNRVPPDMQHMLQRKQYDLSKSSAVIDAFDSLKESDGVSSKDEASQEEREALRASYAEGVLKPLEKRRLNYDRAKVLSPLTTVGNLPYRRLMKTLGCEVTFSEMALALPLVQGSKSEWALTRSHKSETGSFAVQLAAPKPWHAIKAAQAVTELCPSISEINLNCGCPIDLLFRQGAGSALMDNPARIMRIMKGMSQVSGETPVTIKIRTGTKDGHPTARNLVKRLVDEQVVSAITLHGRSRAQRYTKLADWDYVADIAQLVRDERADKELKPWIIGNGDVYSWEDWYDHVENQKVDTCMVARGALIKPWIFEEIDSKQYLDKSATERLEYLRTYANFGLEHWGSDEYGVSQTRRFLCEWMSFTHRYIPVGLLEYLPPKLNDRPPPFKGRNELETLLASNDYRDWIKVSEMFLGPVTDSFEFEPKHKSNAWKANETESGAAAAPADAPAS